MNQDLTFDVEEYWLPIARHLSNGEILYITQYDNKTPLWHGLNYLVYQSGHYVPVFYILVALANAGVAYLIYVWLARNGYYRGGIISAIIYLAAVPLVKGDIINVRSFSLFFLLISIMKKGAIKKGAAVALSVLFSQISAVAVPILLYDGIRNSRNTRTRWVFTYIATGITVGITPFFLIALIYNVDAMVAGFKFSFLSSGEYFLRHPDTGNPFLYPIKWAERLVTMTQRLVFVLLPATGTLVITAFDSRWHWDRITNLSAVFFAVFLITVLIKALTYYWVPVVTFASVLVGVGVERFFKYNHPSHPT